MPLLKHYALVILAGAVAASVGLVQPGPLARARQAYNERHYDAAIAAATEALKIPAQADAAGVVLARAYLDRFAQTPDVADLANARDALKVVDATQLAPRDQAEFAVALGQSLFLDEQFGAAAELFEVALARVKLLDPGARDRLFEWWAGALDHQAQLGPEAERKPLYARILRRVSDELARDDTSTVAWYWLVAASRGADELDRAWSAAIAAWVRSLPLGAQGAALRGDLDRFVTEVIVPERARQQSASGDPRPAMAILQAQWDDVKKQWSR